MFVVCSHAINATFNPHADLPAWNLLMSFAGLGMTLFFVLSGFVIHYNYRHVTGIFSQEGITFFIARFSRLYPLFITMFLAELFYHCFFSGSCNGKHIVSLPMYLTFTHTWFYHIIDGHSLTSQYWTVGGASWSLSTEWFFYIVYAAFGFILLRFSSVRLVLRAAVFIYFFEAAFMLSAWLNMSKISDLGTSHFGVTTNSDSLYRWLVYFWPIARIGEFLLGVLSAQLFLLTTKHKSTLFEQYLADALIWFTILCIIAVHIFLHWEHNGLPGLAIAAPQLYSPLVAILIFLCARYNNVSFTKALVWKPLLVIGEASYSIYLSHLFIISVIWAPLRDKLPHSMAYIGALLTVLLWSIASYHCLERPMKQWTGNTLRRLLKSITARQSMKVMP